MLPRRNLSELLQVDFGEPHYSLVICGTTDPEEDKLLEWYRVTGGPVEHSRLKQPTDGEYGADAAATKEAGPDAGDPFLFNCPDAHGLIAFKIPTLGWSCSVCVKSLPQGSRAFGCRQCNYDVCTDCGLSSVGDTKVVELSGPWTCSGHHGLSLFTVPNNFLCNICHGTIPEGSRAYGCRRCDYDVCPDCSTGHATTRGAAEASAEGSAIVQASETDAAYTRAIIANTIREAQQRLEMARTRMAQQYDQMSIAASAARFSHQSCTCTCGCHKCLLPHQRLSLAASALQLRPDQSCSCTCSCSRCR